MSEADRAAERAEAKAVKKGAASVKHCTSLALNITNTLFYQAVSLTDRLGCISEIKKLTNTLFYKAASLTERVGCLTETKKAVRTRAMQTTLEDAFGIVCTDVFERVSVV